jgi:hypothetical protein
MNGLVPALPHVPSWCAQGQLYRYLTVKTCCVVIESAFFDIGLDVLVSNHIIL